jgi:SAM-dependent methyltransferase
LGWRAPLIQGDPFVIERWAWLRRHLLPGPSQTLDAGCGRGAFTFYAARIGHQALGLTYDEQDVRIAADRAALLGLSSARFCALDLRHLHESELAPESFDQIIACEVIEHILDDAKLLADLARLLKPGGRVYVTTPYKHHIALWQEEVAPLPVEDGGHVRFGYTHDELAALLQPAGIQVCARGYINGYLSQQVNNVYQVVYHLHPWLAWLVTLPLRPFALLDPVVARVTRYPYMTVTAVGVKAAAAGAAEA